MCTRVIPTNVCQENARRIAQRDIHTAREYGIQNFAKDILPISDNLERALEAVKEKHRSEHPLLQALHHGVSMTHTVLHSTLQKHGIRRIQSLGLKFDPSVHNAMYEIPHHPTTEPGHIAQV